MKFSANHLKRYRQIAALLWKYGRSDLAQHLSTEEGFGLDKNPPANGGARKMTVRPPPARPRRNSWRTISRRWVRPM